jgi:hypothetical protein|tara:strand:- start:3900 stop:4139 length:240 start_codon:yes stop_codon:yes gene_type:complete
MSCCRRKEPEKHAKPLSLSLEVVKQRRDTCRKCKYSSKSKDPKFKRFNGLNNTSRCQKVDKLITAITQDGQFKCPIKAF